MAKEQAQLIQDFSGGLDTLNAPNRLSASRSPTHSNVWNDNGALAKRPGQTKISSIGNGDTLFGRGWYGFSAHTSTLQGPQLSTIYGSLGLGVNNLWFVTAASPTTSTIVGNQPTGTVSTAVSSPTVTGIGTNFLTVARVGSMLAIGNTVGQVLTVDSDTQITLTANFGVLNSGSIPIIFPQWASAKRVSFVDMNSKIWVCGPGSPTISHAGSNTMAYVDAFPQANYSLSMANYVFAANTAANPSRVSWSALKDPTTWPASNFVDVSPDDGFPIVGLFYDGQSMVILKTNSAWKLTGTVFDPTNPTYSLTQIYTPSDFVVNSPKTVQLYGNGYIMLGLKGLYSYNGSGAIYKVLDFDKIRGEFANIAAFNWGAVPSVTAEPTSIIVDGNYWLQVPYSLSTISASDKELTYIIDKTGAVWRWQTTAKGIISDFVYLAGTLYGVNSWSGGTPGLIQLDYSSVISDAGSTAITATLTTKVFEFQNQQRFGRCNVFFKKQSAGNLTFEYSIDEGNFVSNTIDMTVSPSGSGGTRTKSSDIVIGSVGRTIQFRLSNSTAAQTFEIYGIEFNHKDLEN